MCAEIKTHKDLEVWKKAISFVTDIYKLTNDFPASELYGLTSQIRRSAVSIPSNIAEGFARTSEKELIHFLEISRSSAAEIETQLIIAKNLDYISESYSEINIKLVEVLKMLSALITKLKSQ